jgi:hypothetical protein
MAQPGGGHPAAQPSSTHPITQPQAGSASQPAAQPGIGYPAQPGAGPSGATSSISIKGILIAAAAIVAIVIAAVAALLLLRPNPPQQTAARQSPTTPANAAPGATPPGVTSGAAAPAGPWFRGTYNYTNTVVSGTITVTSDCPACDATVMSEGRSAIYRWNGTGWTLASCKTQTFTPTGVVNGIVQELSTQDSGGCGDDEGTTGTATRIGD